MSEKTTTCYSSYGPQRYNQNGWKVWVKNHFLWIKNPDRLLFKDTNTKVKNIYVIDVFKVGHLKNHLHIINNGVLD